MKTLSMKAAMLLFALILLAHGTAAADLDNKGKEFISALLPQYSYQYIEVHLSSDVPTSVTVEYPVNSPTFSTTVALTPGTVSVVSLPTTASSAWNPGAASNNAVHMSSDNEFVAYLINRATYTSDAALALPVDTMNTSYIVSTYTEAFMVSQFLVVAAYDNTTVSIIPSVSANTGQPAGVPFNVTLNRGDGYLLQAEPGAGTGLAGTIITSDKPVGMMNGNGCTQVPIGYTACDTVFEVSAPVQTWGKKAAIVDLPNRSGGSLYRVYASADGTEIFQDGSSIGIFNKGQFAEFVVSGSHLISGSNPINVSQFMTGQDYPGSVSGDPSMGNVIPTEQFLKSYTFSTVGGSQFQTHFLTMVVNNSDLATVTLDGSPVGAGAFSPIPGTDFSSANLPLIEGTHLTASVHPHGIYVSGFNDYDSYLYPGGALFQFINPTGDENPPLCGLTAGEPGTYTGSASDNRPSEDTNLNGILDAGEDLNGNGKIDKDTGLFFIELLSGSSNLSIDVPAFVPGVGTLSFSLNKVDSGSPASGVVRVTDGAGNTCLAAIGGDNGCTGESILQRQFSLDGNAFRQKHLVGAAVRLFKRYHGRTSTANKYLGLAAGLYGQNWTLTWTLPSEIQHCANTESCTESSLTALYSAYSANSSSFLILTRTILADLRKRGVSSRIVAGLRAQAEALHARSLDLLGGLPSSTSVCE